MTPSGTPPRIAAVLLAGGAGTRVGAVRNKVYLSLAGRPIAYWSLRALLDLPGLSRLVLVLRPEDVELAHDMLAGEPARRRIEIVAGGATRQESELHALEHLAPAIEGGDIDVVLIHDAARPCVSAELVWEVAVTADTHGGAVPGIPVEDRLLSLDGESVPEGAVVRTQTPQAFKAAPLLAAYRAAARDDFHGTDTALSVERYTDLPVKVVPGDSLNVKVTYPQDLFVVETLLRERGVA